MYVRFLNTFDPSKYLLTVGGQGDDTGGGGGDAIDGGGSLFDRQMDDFISRTDVPAQSTTPAQPTVPAQPGLPSDPNNKQRATPPVQPTAPAQPAPPAVTQPAQKPRPAQNGDLVDAQGNVVARAGAERRYYDALTRARGELDTRDNRIRELEGQVTAYREANTTIERLGLAPQESLTALNLMAQWKANPLGTLKFMLTEAQAMGHNISSLFEGAAPGLDPAAINRILDNKLQPLLDTQRQEREAAEAAERGRQQSEAFFTSYPDARTHDAALGRLLSKHPEWSPETAYYALQNFAIQHGLDWNQPLEQQIIARQNGGGDQPVTTPQQQPPANRSVLPSSRVPAGDARMTDVRQQPRSGADRAKDIVREAMAEAGMTLQ